MPELITLSPIARNATIHILRDFDFIKADHAFCRQIVDIGLRRGSTP
jgi:hypothetical protein